MYDFRNYLCCLTELEKRLGLKRRRRFGGSRRRRREEEEGEEGEEEEEEGGGGWWLQSCWKFGEGIPRH